MRRMGRTRSQQEGARETGIAVNYDTHELNHVLESRLLVRSAGLDLVSRLGVGMCPADVPQQP
jgi:hypothetical protein